MASVVILNCGGVCFTYAVRLVCLIVWISSGTRVTFAR
jgi:hypothetical protein